MTSACQIKLGYNGIVCHYLPCVSFFRKHYLESTIRIHRIFQWMNCLWFCQVVITFIQVLSLYILSIRKFFLRELLLLLLVLIAGVLLFLLLFWTGRRRRRRRSGGWFSLINSICCSVIKSIKLMFLKGSSSKLVPLTNFHSSLFSPSFLNDTQFSKNKALTLLSLYLFKLYIVCSVLLVFSVFSDPLSQSLSQFILMLCATI